MTQDKGKMMKPPAGATHCGGYPVKGQRFHPSEFGDGMIPAPRGDWVSFTDLEAERTARLAAELERDEHRQHAQIWAQNAGEAEASLEAALTAKDAEIARLRDALTPSGETKAAYMGEFSIPFPVLDEEGNEVLIHPNVPWTTIKEIMSAILARAALEDTP